MIMIQRCIKNRQNEEGVSVSVEEVWVC